MEAAESAFHDAVKKVRQLTPRGSTSHAISRDHWMPDSSCSVCYECDSQFSLFNRRHHCRVCGRIFCGKCTQNTICVTDEHSRVQEEGECIRVCKFCSDSREKDSACSNGGETSTLTLTPSSSCHRLASDSISSSTASSAFPEPGLMGSNFRTNLAEFMEAVSAKRPFNLIGLGRTSHRSVSPRAREGSRSPYDFCNKSRSEDDDDESQRETEDNTLRPQQMPTHSKQEEDACSGCVHIDDPRSTSSHVLASDCSSYCREHIETAGADSHNIERESKFVKNLTDGTGAGIHSLSDKPGAPLDYCKGVEERADDNSSCASSCNGPQPSREAESPLDVESNPSIWAAPPPEDEEVERAIGTGGDDDDDDGDDDNTLAFSTSFGNMSCNKGGNREKLPSEEHLKTKREVVNGHFRVLVAQLLCSEGIEAEDSGKESWLEIVTALAVHAASLVKPDTNGGMDPGGYVKVKCVAAGLPSESRVVKGIVCKKNVAHRRMRSLYEKPKLLLLGCALEYQRVSNHFSSLDTLLQQETDHLRMAVARIQAHHPNVLLVEKSVSRQAQERLLTKEISFVLNVKRNLLERIAKFTSASIVSSLDHLNPVRATKMGLCEFFHVEKYVEEHGSAGQGGKKLQKSLMFFEGCPKQCGCTILLKGSNGDELKKVKRAVQFAVFAAHHLALETSFLADEGATLPEFKSPLSVTLRDKQSKSISTLPGVFPASQLQAGNGAQDCTFFLDHAAGFHHSGSMSDLDSSLRKGNSDTSSMASSVNSSPQHREEDMMISADVKSSASDAGYKVHKAIGKAIGKLSSNMSFEDFERSLSGLSASLKKNYLETLSTQAPKFSASEIPASTQENKSICTSDVCTKSSINGSPDSPPLLEDCTVDKQLERTGSNDILPELHHDSQFHTQDSEFKHLTLDEFSPSRSDHQSILVSLSSSCLRRRTVCERGHLFRIKYYGPSDQPLGRFLRTVFDLGVTCPSCGEPKCVHVDCYTHQQGTLTISVHRDSNSQPLPGEREGKIWMWHRCLKCPRKDGVPRPTHRVAMSDFAWGLSFGKFLELSFSNHAAASRLACCGHSLHRDCLRFYGFGEMVACFRYSPVKVYSVCLPPSKLEFLFSKQQDWLQQEVDEVAGIGDNFFKKMSSNLHEIEKRMTTYSIGKTLEVKRRISDMQGLLLNQKDRFKATLQTASEPHADILELNCIRRMLSILSPLWDDAMQNLLCSLKASKSAFGFDSVDSFFSFLKEISFGSLKNKRPVENKEVTTIMTANVDCSSQEHVQGTGFSAILGNRSPAAIVQTDEDKLIHANESPSDAESTTRVSNDHALGNELAVSGFEDMRSNNSNEDSSKEVPKAFHKDKMMVSIPDSNRALFSDTRSESRSANSSDSSGSSIWPLKGTGLANKNISAFKDLSGTFEATWTGRGQSVEAQSVDVATNGEENPACNASSEMMTTSNNLPCREDNLSSEGVDESLTDSYIPKIDTETYPCSQEHEVTGADSQFASTLISPAKSGQPSNIEGWVGLPYSSLYGNPQSQPSSSSPKRHAQILSSSPLAVMSHADELMGHERNISLPVGINDTIISVYVDEPTSIIAYAITSRQHQIQLSERSVDKDKQKDKEKEHTERLMLDHYMLEAVVSHPLQQVDGSSERGDSSIKYKSSNTEHTSLASSNDQSYDDPLLSSKSMHVKICFTDDISQEKIKYTVTCYNAKQFDALRKKCCPFGMDFIRSLCRCKKWGAQGGKSNVFFAKTVDDRIVVKQVTKTELESFLSFAPAYFKYISDALNSGNPTCLAKILGIYRIIVKHGKLGKEVRMDLMVMENLLYGRQLTRIYDLKGCVRSRYNADSSGKNTVLLDQNLLELMLTSPIFISNKAKHLLERAVWNDTGFLATVDVMDYSLLVGIDEERQDLVLGIIDFMRQYTWDKHLETWVKASGILGGPKNASPTVISPEQYKKRFRKAMTTYFLMLPDQWSSSTDEGSPQGEKMNEGSSLSTKGEASDHPETNLQFAR